MKELVRLDLSPKDNDNLPIAFRTIFVKFLENSVEESGGYYLRSFDHKSFEICSIDRPISKF